MAPRAVTEAMPQHGELNALIGWAPKRSVARPRDSSKTAIYCFLKLLLGDPPSREGAGPFAEGGLGATSGLLNFGAPPRVPGWNRKSLLSR